MASPVQCTTAPLAGLYQATQLARMYYGSGAVKRHIAGCLPGSGSKALIVTGQSLATRTPVVSEVERALGSAYAGTFSRIGAHAPAAAIDEADRQLAAAADIDTVVSVGGGSPIDAAKALSARAAERTGRHLRHIAVPTTLGAAEATPMAGFTRADGIKTGLRAPELVPWAVLYDAGLVATHTPPRLAMSTAIRALDHAVELLAHPNVAEVPAKALGLQAIATLFVDLPRFRADPADEDVVTRLQLAAFASLAGVGLNLAGPMGLSHTLGYAIGSPYGVPHGITSCITLGPVVRMKARSDPEAAKQIARALPYAVRGATPSGDHAADAARVADAIDQLVKELGLATTLTEQNVPRDQLDTIVQRATNKKEGELFDAVKALVEKLY